MLKKIIIFTLIFFPLTTQAASLYLDPAAGEYGPGSVFGVNVKLETDKSECINAAEINMDFSKSLLQFQDFSAGESVFTLWISRPDMAAAEAINRAGKLSFSGGVPGGYCGNIPGDPGESNILGKIFFKVPENARVSADSKGTISFSDGSSILLNDGFGTQAKLATARGEYVISDKAQGGVDEWQDVLKGDKIQPEPFVVELDRNDTVHSGKYFIIFSTTDKQSGIDHYEVMETKLSDLAKQAKGGTWLDLLFKKAKKQDWKDAVSPYALSDQNLQSQVKVKAVDKAGNERIVEFTPSDELKGVTITGSKDTGRLYLSIFIIIGIILVISTAVLIRKKRSKNG